MLDKFARGGDARLQPGRGGARAVLGRPEGRLVFAGEATGPAPQTVHGAVLSGLHAARLCLAGSVAKL